jgi:hypothetical protein
MTRGAFQGVSRFRNGIGLRHSVWAAQGVYDWIGEGVKALGRGLALGALFEMTGDSRAQTLG